MRPPRGAYVRTLIVAVALAALGCGSGARSGAKDAGPETGTGDATDGGSGGGSRAGTGGDLGTGGGAGAGGGAGGAAGSGDGGGLAGTGGGAGGAGAGGAGAGGTGTGGAGAGGAGTGGTGVGGAGTGGAGAGGAGAGGRGTGGAGCACVTLPPCAPGAPAACAALWVDTDNDGLSDAWEDAGCVDLDCNGSCGDAGDIPLPGANRLVRDIYIRYDYMVATTTNDVGTPPHSHQPPPAALDQVKQAFAAHGIALHWIAPGGSIPEHRVATRDPAPTSACAGPDFVTMRALRAQAFAPYASALGPLLRHPAYHYLVFAHNSTLPDTAVGSLCPFDPECLGFPDSLGSGSADILGDDIIIAFGADIDQGFTDGIERIAGTTLHEIGHNLGLKHGSLAAAAPQTCLTQKPNYVSVMDYSYQNGIPVATAPGSTTTMFCATDADCDTGVCATPGACHCTDDLGTANSCYRIDYANDQLINLYEAQLDESLGVGGPAGDQDMVRFYSDSNGFLGAAFGPIDWNNSGGIETSVAVDLDNDSGTPNTVLQTTTDWDKLQLAFQCSSSWGAGAPVDDTTAGTAEVSMTTLRRHHAAYPPSSVRIDIRPGCAPNWIIVGGAGDVPVALFGSRQLAVSTVDPSSLALGGVPAVSAKTMDVDGDGLPDLVVDFPMASLPVTAGSTRLTLSGWQTNSRAFSGSDAIAPIASSGPGHRRR